MLNKYECLTIDFKINDSPSKEDTIFENLIRGRYINNLILNEDEIFLISNLISDCIKVNYKHRKELKDLLCNEIFTFSKELVSIPSRSISFPAYEKIRKLTISQEFSYLGYNIYDSILSINTLSYLFNEELLKFELNIENIPNLITVESDPNKTKFSISHVLSKKIEINLDINSILAKLDRIETKNILERTKVITIHLEKSFDLLIEKYICYSIYDIKSKYSLVNGIINSILFYSLINDYRNNKINQVEFQQIIRSKKLHIISFLRRETYDIMLDLPNLPIIPIPNICLINNDNENRHLIEISKEIQQIQKDLNRAKEYNLLLGSFEGQNMIIKLFTYLLINDDKFYYCQGMDSIAISSLVLYYPNLMKATYCFKKIIEKIFYFLLEEDKKVLKPLTFFHTILSRLLSFFDPELYIHLKKLSIFTNQAFSSWIITLFSRSFEYKYLFRIWDFLLIEKAHCIYLIIVGILLQSRDVLICNDEEFILTEYIPYINLFIDLDKVLHKAKDINFNTPQTMMPLTTEYKSEEIRKDLENNEYYKDRWWEFKDYWEIENNSINTPVIYLEDLSFYNNRIIYLDIRTSEEHDLVNIKQSLFFTIKAQEDDYMSIKLDKIQTQIIDKLINNENKIIIVIGSKDSNYFEINYLLEVHKIKHMTILQGGIDVLFIDKPELINK